MIILSYVIKKDEEKRLVQITDRTDNRNKAKYMGLLEKDFLIKRYLATLNILCIQELINKIAGCLDDVRVTRLYVIHYERCYEVKSFKLVTDEFTIIKTFDLTRPKYIKTELIRELGADGIIN